MTTIGVNWRTRVSREQLCKRIETLNKRGANLKIVFSEKPKIAVWEKQRAHAIFNSNSLKETWAFLEGYDMGVGLGFRETKRRMVTWVKAMDFVDNLSGSIDFREDDKS